MTIKEAMNNQDTHPTQPENADAEASLNIVPIAIFRLDSEGKIIEVNNQTCQMYGYSTEELVSKTIFDIDLRVTSEKWSEHWQALYKEHSRTIESVNKRKDGTTFPVQITVNYYEFQGKGYSFSFVQDISQRKILEENARKRNYQYKEALRIAQMGIWEYDVNTSYFSLNDQYYTLHGTTVAEAGGNLISLKDFRQKYVPPQHWHDLDVGVRGAMTTQDPRFDYQTESRIFRVDGEIRDVIIWIGIEKDDQNRTVKIFGLTQDITKQKNTEQALRRSNDLLKAIINTAPTAIIGLDLKGHVSSVWNRAAEQMFGWSADEVMGRYLPTVPADQIEDYQKNLALMQRGVTLQGMEARRQKCGGVPIDYSIYSSPLIDENQEFQGSIAVLVDITERKKDEDSLRRVNRQLRMLSDCNQALIRASDEKELLATICNITVEIGGYRLAWVGFALDDLKKTVIPVAFHGEESGYLRNANITWADNERGRGPIGTTIRTGKPVPIQNIMEDARFSPWREDAARRGYAAVCGLPLTAGEHTFGALGIYSGSPDSFDPDEVKLLNELASDLAMGIMMLRTRIERKRAEEALKESEFFLRKSQSVALIGSYYFDARTGIWISSHALDDVFGIDDHYTKDINGWIELIHPDDKEEMLRYLSQYVIAQHNRFDREYRIICQNNGQERWVHGLGELEYDEHGNTIKMIGTIQDITLRKKTEIFLQALNHAANAMQRARVPNQIFTVIADELTKIGFTCAFFVIDAKKEILRPVYLSYPNYQLAEKFAGLRADKILIPIRQADVLRETVLDRKTVFLTSLDGLTSQILPKSISHLAGRIIDHLGLKKSILAPLIADNEIIGLFTIQSSDLHENDIPAVTAFAHQIAAAWRQLQLYEQAQQEIAARKEAEMQVRNLNEALENRVKERTAQLQITNEELEAFAYSVSHDLRAPLRAINGYSQILAEDYEVVLDDEGKRVCGIISKEAQRMGQLIDDLLAFSRLARADMQVFPVDMQALVNSIFNELILSDERKKIHFHLNPIPGALADPALIRQVWVNLISNALKFTKYREQAVIEIGSTSGDGEVTYWIKDNGAGFDERYIYNLFGVFRRLHSEKEFEGTGVGLAIVQRVIKRHGGRVWATGEVNLGATFFFTLPHKG
jgi:PAS domain S-box-containing protein